MRNTVLSVRRAIVRWQLNNLTSSIENILIARNQALATMMELESERAVKERELAGMETAEA